MLSYQHSRVQILLHHRHCNHVCGQFSAISLQHSHLHDEPQCAAVCPVDCCVPDEDNVESEEFLLTKQSFMHGDNGKQSSNENSSWFSVKS